MDIKADENKNKNKMWEKLSTPPPLFTSIDGGWPCYATGEPIPLDDQRRILGMAEFNK